MLSAVQFVSPSDGWVVGSDRILHTTDGGSHWATQFRTRPKAQLGAIDFVDADHGWVTGPSEILATTDGGAHWQSLPEPCPPIRTVHFVSRRDGFAVAGVGVSYWGVTDPPLAGGILLRTTDGGARWHRLHAPPDVQSACFNNAQHGWLSAGGAIYGTADGGRTWSLSVRARSRSGTYAEIECARPRAAWAEVIGPGVALGHEPQIGYHMNGRSWRPIFVEGYTAGPALWAHVKTESPGPYPGPFSAVSANQAVFIGGCSACSVPPPSSRGPAAVPMDVAVHGGTVLLRRGQVGELSYATGTAFVSSSDGWVTGLLPAHRAVSALEHTADGGRSWQVQYVLKE
jgi:photosystem II stability/assembly factor-like uncharacterized protein